MTSDTFSDLLMPAMLLALFVGWVGVRVPPYLRRRRLRKKQWLRARQRCDSCGYDIHGSVEQCPECGTVTGRLDRVGDLNFVQQDIPCHDCGVSLHGRSKSGTCPACGHRVGFSLRAHARQHLGCPMQSVNFVKRALALAGARQRGITGDDRAHFNPRDICLIIRDRAIREAGGLDAARALLIALGLTSSERIGRVIRQFVESELLMADPVDSLGDFKNLFDLDTLFAASAVNPSMTPSKLESETAI